MIQPQRFSRTETVIFKSTVKFTATELPTPLGADDDAALRLPKPHDHNQDIEQQTSFHARLSNPRLMLSANQSLQLDKAFLQQGACSVFST